MSEIVLDASALLAMIKGERGAAKVAALNAAASTMPDRTLADRSFLILFSHCSHCFTWCLELFVH